MARKWSNLNLPGALHYVTSNYIHNNPLKAKLVTSAKDYYWPSFRSFYSQGDEPLAVDHEWWWLEDADKLSKAMKELGWYSYWKRKEEG